jgi:hypothetical protein
MVNTSITRFTSNRERVIQVIGKVKMKNKLHPSPKIKLRMVTVRKIGPAT